jgi:hypothetical protein
MRFLRNKEIETIENSKLHQIEKLNDKLCTFDHPISAAVRISQDDADLIVFWNYEIRNVVYDSLIVQLNDCLLVMKDESNVEFNDINFTSVEPTVTKLFLSWNGICEEENKRILELDESFKILIEKLDFPLIDSLVLHVFKDRIQKIARNIASLETYSQRLRIYLTLAYLFSTISEVFYIYIKYDKPSKSMIINRKDHNHS